MSNKLVKNEEQKEGIVFVWGKVLVTTKAFNEQMEGMVLGEDYYLEDIVIIKGLKPVLLMMQYLRTISSTTRTEKPGSIINGCRYRGRYIRNMLWEIA